MSLKNKRHKVSLFSVLLATAAIMPLSSCEMADNMLKADRSTNSEVQDYRDALAPREIPAQQAAPAEDIPALESYVADNTAKLKPTPLVSISINQSIPLRDALFELAKQANYDLELDPRIQGSVIFTARNKPLDVVLDRVCEIAGLRFKMDDDSIRIELDTPYTKNYRVDYLNIVRKNTSQLTTNVKVEAGATGANSGSSADVSTSAETDFWLELDTNLKQILASNASGSYLRTSSDPDISLVSSNPPAPPVAVPAVDEASLNGDPGVQPPAAPAAAPAAQQTAPAVNTQIQTMTPSPQLPASTVGAQAPAAAQPAATTAAPVTGTAPAATQTAPLLIKRESNSVESTFTSGQVAPATTSAAPAAATAPAANASPAAAPPPAETVLRVDSLPPSSSSASGSTSGGSPNDVSFTPTFSINKQAGIVSVFANERLHRKIQDYLDQVGKSVKSQVLIEAKVLEVNLSDEFATGIDWSTIAKSLGDFTLGFNGGIPSLTPTTATSASINFAGDDVTAAVNLLSRFGTVHALSSPRLTVMNNQPAVLSVAENRVYFELDVTTTQSDSSTVTTVDSDIRNIPEGIIINVMPSIDQDSQSVTMQLRPTISRIVDFVNDPAVSFAAAQISGAGGAGIESQIPVVNVQEMDSVVKVPTGQIMIMGGLLQDRTAGEREAVPGLGEAPVIGGLFRNHADKVEKTELVVFLKATIINDPQDSIHNTDRELYRTYSQDRRPDNF